MLILILLTALATTQPATTQAALAPGNHVRQLTVAERERTYLVHIPASYDPRKPTPVVIALHGAAMNGPMMVGFTGLNQTSEKEGFIVVYPSGTGLGPFLTWNAGGFTKNVDARPDDIGFIRKMLDDLEASANVDPERVFACGMSNGGMMCYRLAAELSDRIAAVAPVSGTIAIEKSAPTRAVPIIHFHGTKDTLVPFEKPPGRPSAFLRFMAVDESIQTWVKLDACDAKPASVETLSKEGDELKATRTTYAGGKDGAEVVLITIEGAGHTWPGMKPPVEFLGKSAMNISANDLIWEFFKKHPMK